MMMDYSELELHAVALANGDTSGIARISDLLFAVAERGRKMDAICKMLADNKDSWVSKRLTKLAQEAEDALKIEV
jgi:hypothetical protein